MCGVNTATVLLPLVPLVAVAGAAAGLRALVEFAERRRRVRWAHILARFCGDSSCGVCRSRSLPDRVPVGG